MGSPGAAFRMLLFLFFCVIPITSRARAGIGITVLEGEGAINNIRLHRAKEPVVRVEDDQGQPIPGAAVHFVLPLQGAGGSFSGENTLVGITDENGVAVGRGLRPNKIAGPFEIRVTASARGATASARVSQINAEAAGGSSGKKIALVAILGGAAVGALAAATRGGNDNTKGGATTGASGPPGTVVVPGSPSLGPPQ